MPDCRRVLNILSFSLKFSYAIEKQRLTLSGGGDFDPCPVRVAQLLTKSDEEQKMNSIEHLGVDNYTGWIRST